ncbi:MAG: ATP-binding protein, partial [Thermoplasmataceae archaeon]
AVLARIEKIISRSELIGDGLDFESLGKYVENSITYNSIVCVARVVGLFSGGKLTPSREIILPGSLVERAPSSMLESVFSFSSDEAMHIGYLSGREDVRVMVSVKGLMRHLAILAQTGAGKSHAAAVLMEELLKKGASIIVLDPHADYALMRQSDESFRYRGYIQVFRTQLSTGRYDAFQKGIVRDFTLRFSDLEPDDLAEIMDVRENWTNLRKAITEAYESMSGAKDFDDFLRSVKSLDSEENRHLLARIRLLGKVRNIFGTKTTTIDEYLRPGHMTVLDLTGMDQFLANYFSYRVLREIYQAKVEGKNDLPVFIFVEEAHNFIPPGANTLISQMIRRIAGEGRKFGMFLVVITQRPGKIEQDVLSQCNSEIVLRITNPIDQRSILESGEEISQWVIDDLPSLSTGEAILVGPFVRIPVNVKIRERHTREGGGDIDILGLLSKAREEREAGDNPEVLKGRISKFLGD